jgi:hypothetical protein
MRYGLREMPKPTSQLKAFKRQGVAVLVLLLCFGAYYALVVRTQTNYFTNRDFRVLAAMGDQIRGVVGTLASSITNAAMPPARLPDHDTNGSPFLTAIHDANPAPSANPTQDLARIEKMVGLVPNLALIEKPSTVAAETNVPAAPGLVCEVVPAGTASWLRFEYQGGTNSNLRLKLRANLARLLEPIVNRSEFDDLLLVATNGEILYQRVTGPLRIARLVIPGDNSLATNLVNYAGAEYRLFAQPVRFTLPSGGSAPPSVFEWSLCGLVKAERFRSDTLAVNYTVLLLFVLTGLLLLLSWPFLDVCFLGQRGSLRPATVALLACSTLAMNGLLTLLVLDLCAYHRTKEELDAGMRGFARSLRQNLRAELKAIASQAETLNERFGQIGSATNRTHLLDEPRLVTWSGSAPDPYPFFEMAIWNDRRGNQLVKWTVKGETTRRLNVAQRSFFRAIVEDRPWTLQESTGLVRFCMEPLYSLNTGENLVMFSTIPRQDTNVVMTLDVRLLSLAKPVLPAGYGFCVVDGAGHVLFHSDERRNLRENFFEECNADPTLRAAVLGRLTGQFDSYYARRLHSLYATPIADLPWSLIVFRDEQVLGTANVEIVTLAVLLFLNYGLLLALAYIVAHLIGGGHFAAWLWPDEKRTGAYAILALLNLALALALGAVILFSGSAERIVVSALVLPGLGLLLAPVVMAVWGHKPGWIADFTLLRRWRDSHRLGYVVSMSLLLLLVSVLPMMAFFKVAFESEVPLLVRHAQLQLSADLESRASRLWSELSGLEDAASPKPKLAALPDRAAFFEKRLTNTWDVYASFFLNTTIRWLPPSVAAPPNPASEPTWLDRALAAFRPHYNELEVRTRAVMPDAAADGSWEWTNRPGRLVLTRSDLRIPTRDGPQSLQVESDQPALPTPSLPWFLALLAVFAAPFGILYVVARRVLLLDFVPLPGGAGSRLAAGFTPSLHVWGPGKYLLLGPPRTGKTGLLTEAHFARLRPDRFRQLDLRRAEDRKLLEGDQLEEPLRDTGLALVVDHFDYDLDNLDFNRQKLRFLGRFACDEARTVIVVSSVYPLYYKITDEAKSEDKAQSGLPGPVTAWSEALEPYKRLYSQVRGHVSAAPTPEGHTSQEARALYRGLWQTCSPGEQELLYEVAQRRLVSSNRPELRTCLGRGLLVRDPALRLMNEVFQRFVLSHYQPETAVAERPDEPTNLWQTLKAPALSVLILLALFFFLTQQELWNKSVGIATAFLTGFGVLAKGFEQLQKAQLKNPGDD